MPKDKKIKCGFDLFPPVSQITLKVVKGKTFSEKKLIGFYKMLQVIKDAN